MVLASPQTVQRLEKQICGFSFSFGRKTADLWFWLLHKPYNDLTSRFVVLALLYWPYNDLNSKFLVLASVLAEQRLELQICGFGISVGRKKADLWFWLLYWPYKSRFVVLASKQTVQRRE